ncbi:MAG: Stf0 sulfotransferase [Bradyrhizobium sp.]|nr:Stf0 sulfotransferase [Bradyrhizobium sp.]
MILASSTSQINESCGYVICTTQRSGSNYLCELLASTGVLGLPREYFNGAGRRRSGWHDYPDDPGQQCEMILQHGRTANGIYGLKIFPHQFDAVAENRWPERLPNLHWVYLGRSDLLGQAISLSLARQSDQWRSYAPPGRAAVYSAAHIAQEVNLIAQSNARWRLYFARNGITPLELTYEALEVDPQNAVSAIAQVLSLDDTPTINWAHVKMRVQRNQVNEDWRRRFLVEQANLSSMDSLAGPANASADPSLTGLTCHDRREASAGQIPASLETGLRVGNNPSRSLHTPPGTRWYVPWRNAGKSRKPRLTVSIITRNSEIRLESVLANVSKFADEIVVGVDTSSTDRTLEIASSHANTVYQFRLKTAGQLAPARMLALEYATGDWILSLDDDECMEESFADLLPQLMNDPKVNYYFLSRKWIVNLDPCEYLHGPPHFPNWALRLFRNDRSLVWKPSRVHSQYHVQGMGYFEPRASILHFEPVWCSPAKRAIKMEEYRSAGAAAYTHAQYAPSRELRRRPAVLPKMTGFARLRRRAVVHTDVHDLTAANFPPWGVQIVSADLSPEARPGEHLVANVVARNTGVLAWSPPCLHKADVQWPLITLSYHVIASNQGQQRQEGLRAVVPRHVAPGEEVNFIITVQAPQLPGEYQVEWDMVSESECWFAACGGHVLRSALKIN